MGVCFKTAPKLAGCSIARRCIFKIWLETDLQEKVPVPKASIRLLSNANMGGCICKKRPKWIIGAILKQTPMASE